MFLSFPPGSDMLKFPGWLYSAQCTNQDKQKTKIPSFLFIFHLLMWITFPDSFSLDWRRKGVLSPLFEPLQQSTLISHTERSKSKYTLFEQTLRRTHSGIHEPYGRTPTTKLYSVFQSVFFPSFTYDTRFDITFPITIPSEEVVCWSVWDSNSFPLLWAPLLISKSTHLRKACFLFHDPFVCAFTQLNRAWCRTLSCTTPAFALGDVPSDSSGNGVNSLSVSEATLSFLMTRANASTKVGHTEMSFTH